MKERRRDLLSELGESFDYLRRDVRNLSHYMAELEELAEAYRMFAATATFSMPEDQAVLRKLLKKTSKILGPPPTDQQEERGPVGRETEKAASGNEIEET